MRRIVTYIITPSLMGFLLILLHINLVSAQSCPPEDTLAVTPAQNSYNFPLVNNWHGVEIMTWNIKEFAQHSTTINLVNEIIADGLPDVIAIQEIEDMSEFTQLSSSLPAYEFIHTNYNSTNLDLGLAVRKDCAEILSSQTLFPGDGWAFAGRYPLQAEIDWHCGSSYLNFEIINVHYKAYDEGFDQRYEASEILENYISDNPNTNIVVAGDFNDHIDDPQNFNSLWPLVNSSNAYFVTTSIAGNSYHNSFPWGSYAGLIDHILISAPLFNENENGNTYTLRLDDYMGSSSYQNYISDHRPVVWEIPIEATDLNLGLVINEIHQNPAAVSDADGEWVEITNTSSENINLNGLILRDNGNETHTISTNVWVAPDAFIILGAEGNIEVNGGVSVDYEYSDFSLSNLWDEVIIEHPSGVILDEVHYDNGVTFPDESGISMMLLSPEMDNSIGGNWMAATTPFGAGDLGTPGEANFSDDDCEPLGDMNDDEGFNVLDVVILANCVLENTCESNCASDMNQDGVANVLDIVQLVNCILANSCGN